MKAEMHTQSVQLEFWRRRANELEQSLNLSTVQTQRWRVLAQETVEKLWDLGQAVKMDEFMSEQEASVSLSKAVGG
jgi:hypothetical protein